MTRILVVDDHKIARLGICTIIQSISAAIEADEAGNYKECMRQIRNNEYQLIMLDANLPGSNAFTLLEHILIAKPKQKVLIITMNPEGLYALRFLKEGAWGYLEKTADDAEIKDAIVHILNGHKQFSPQTVDALIQNSKSGRKNNPFDNLTNREIEVMQQLVKGIGVSDIAHKLNLHIATITTYKTRIFEKTGVHNIIDLNELSKQFNTSG